MGYLRISMWMFFLAISITTSSRDHGHKPAQIPPKGEINSAKTTDLRAFGFTGFEPKEDRLALVFTPDPLCFISDDTLVATFVTHDQQSALVHREEPAGSPLMLHAIFLDSASGDVRARKEWHLLRPRGGIIAAGNDRFAVLTLSSIELYSPSLQFIERLEFSSDEQKRLRALVPSPSGKSIVAMYLPHASYQWVDTITLTRRPISIPKISFSISDDQVALKKDTFIAGRGFLSEVQIRTGDGPWQTICSVLPGQVDHCGWPRFLNNDYLVLTRNHGLTVLPTTGGDSILKASFRDDEWLEQWLYPSLDGKRFAVTIWAHKGGNELLDITARSELRRIVIYDINRRQAIYNFTAKRLALKSISGIALSPDGSRMAVLEDGIVKIFTIPD